MRFPLLSFLSFGDGNLRFVVCSCCLILLSFWLFLHSLISIFHHISSFLPIFSRLQAVSPGEFSILSHFCFEFHFSNVPDIFSSSVVALA